MNTKLQLLVRRAKLKFARVLFLKSFYRTTVIKYKRLQEPNLSSSYLNINSKSELIDCLRKIKKRIKNEKLFPILHFETHGSENGLHLANGECLSWEEFFSETREINIALKNSLILNLSMCHGISLIGKIDPLKRAPFRAIVATSKEITWKNLLEGFEIFYDEYFFSFSATQSVVVANKVLEKEGARFNYFKVEHFIDSFTDVNRDPVFFERLVNDFAVKEKATNPRFKNMDYKAAYEHCKEKILKIMDEAKKQKEYFLMKDITKRK